MTRKFINWPNAQAKGIPFSKDTAKRKAAKGYFPRFVKFGGPRSPDFLDDAEVDEYLRDPESFIAKATGEKAA
jgi:hypothetical protein